MASLFKDAKIIDGNGKQVDISSFSSPDKKIGIYFSAHWCPPCRGFTPVLAEFYKSVKSENFEIIFVSSDRDAGSFKSYFDTMPWLALDFEDREKKEELSNKFSIRGIPSLIVVDGTGAVKDAQGRNSVTASPKALPGNW